MSRNEWAGAGKIPPIVYERLPRADAVRAPELLESGRATGKEVLVP